MINVEKLRMIYNFGKNVNLADAQVLLKNAQSKSFAQGEYLIKEGQLRKEVFWLRKGLVRAFRIMDRGDERTTMLRWENQIVASPHLTLFNQPAQQYFEALEPTTVFYLDYDKFQSIITNNPKLDANRKFVFQHVMKQALQRIDSFVLLSPEERYLDFIKTKPEIANRVPDKYLAHILGITPVSLSRIRKRIAAKKK